MKLKVSIIIPTYKRGQFLERAIDSVVRQTYFNIQIIVVDDNGNNNKFREETEERMLKYENNENIIYIKNPTNIGGSKSRNVGIRESNGDYITFLDDDDVYLPDKVKLQLEYMCKYNLELSFYGCSHT